MSNELWFEAAATQGRSRVVLPTNRPPVSVPSVPTRPVDPVTQTVICNKCDKGYGVSNMFPGTVCPQGWTLDKDPCNTPIVKGPPVVVTKEDEPFVIDPILTDPILPYSPAVVENVVTEPITEVPVTPTPVVVVNPEPVEGKKDNNDLILYIAIGVGAYLLLKK
jgi:hypothetical protein|tara:strand:- start:4112 stop:4603 length:492 start_codon:yes stop_codon:yes gene_type:complete